MQAELQACEHCSKEFPIETMRMMEDCWFCPGCTADWQAHFDRCEHVWEPHVNSMGDAGQYCTSCMGFVCNEDMPLIAEAKCKHGNVRSSCTACSPAKIAEPLFPSKVR